MKLNYTLLVASNNQGKLKEFKSLLAPYFDRVICPNDISLAFDVEETGTTFLENAVLKATEIGKLVPHMAVLSDDSGICVDALGGAPGVYSARYAGVHGDNDACLKKLLDNMKNKPDRAARFECALALRLPDGRLITARGVCEGEVANERIGTGGFGYDSVFWSHELNTTFAAAAQNDKDAVSHRGRALKSLAEQLQIV